MIWEPTTTRTLEGEEKEKDQLEKEFFIGVHSIFNAKCCIYRDMYFVGGRRPIAHISFSKGSMSPPHSTP